MKRVRISFVSLSSVFLLLCSGCATTGDLNKVESKLLTLREEFETVRNKQARILGELARLQADLKGFKGVFDSFQKKGQYNFANIGVKMDELRTLHQELLGKHQMLQTEFEKLSEQHKKLLQSYSSRFGDPTAVSVSSSGQVTIQVVSPKALYDAAKALYDAGKYREAREQLKLFIQKYPQDDLTDDAYLLLGDCYYQMRNYFEAIIWYNDTRKKFPQSDLLDVALLRLGEAHYKIGACDEGKAFLRVLLRSYPRSTHAPRARELRRKARQFCKGR